MMFLSLFSGVEGALREAHRQINSSQDGLHDVPRRISVGNRPPASGQDPEFTADIIIIIIELALGRSRRRQPSKSRV